MDFRQQENCAMRSPIDRPKFEVSWIPGLASLIILLLVASSQWAGPVRAQQGPDPDDIEVSTELVVGGFERPVEIANAHDGSGRIFVLEKVGRVRIVTAAGELLPEAFLDIRDRVESRANERGLLGLAFHPNYAENGYFYVNYTTSRANGEAGNGDTVVARYRVTDDDADRADPDSEMVLLTLDQPFSNHNGGDLAFGPDGYLYISTGDGGQGGDPLGAGQRRDTFLAKLLRIDVDGGEPYAVPEDNPFVGESSMLPEIWAWGLRNPWRIAFDIETGDLYIGDVGQNAWEEVDFQPADSQGGENYGWNTMEGFHCYGRQTCDQDGLVLPIFEYNRQAGQSITGGEVYRGPRFEAMDGLYLVADYVTGNLWGLSRDAGGDWRNAKVGDLGFGATSFGLDEAGEMYVVFDSNQNTPQAGTLRRIIQSNAPAESPTAEPGGLIAPGATPRQLSSGHTFTEGPAVDFEGKLYFSDVRQNKIHLLALDETVSTYREDVVQPNGLYFDASGRMVICDMGGRRILRDADPGKGEPLETLAEAWDGKRLNRTNDLWIAPDGSVYFSDPYFGAAPTPQEIADQQVYRIPPDGGAVERLTEDLVQPNGLIGTPDGKLLYITDSSGGTWRYAIEADGSLSGKTRFAEVGGDGMTLDERGNVYIASDVVRVFSPAGEAVVEIPLPERPSNLTFGGGAAREDRKTLYVTARTGLYAIDMNVAGAFAPPGRPGGEVTPTPEASTPTAPPTVGPVDTPRPSATPTMFDDNCRDCLYLPWLQRP
jgi:sugar lactone lactonase YvrE